MRPARPSSSPSGGWWRPACSRSRSRGAVALSGLGLFHFWTSLILLGIGWNFGFIGATAMVAECHTPAERGKAQGTNDFLVFGVVAAASFFSGSLLHAAGWQLISWLIFPAVAFVLVPLLWRAGRSGMPLAERP